MRKLVNRTLPTMLLALLLLPAHSCGARAEAQAQIGNTVMQVDEMYGEPKSIEELPNGMHIRHYERKKWSIWAGALASPERHDVTFQNGRVVSVR